MKRVFLLLGWLVLLSPGIAFAQGKRTAKFADAELIARVDALNDSAFYSREPGMKRDYATEAESLALKAHYKKGLADSHVRLGQAFLAVDDWKTAEQYLRMALTERTRLGNKPDIASGYNELGRLFKAQERYDTAIVMYRQGLAAMKDQPPHVNTVALNTHLGHLYRLVGKFELARQYLEAAMHLIPYLIVHPPADYTAAELELRLCAARLDMAEFLQSTLHRYPAAKDSLLKCLSTYKSLQDRVSEAKCLLLLGNNAYGTRALDSARSYYDRGIAMGETIHKGDLYTLYRNRGRIYLEQGFFQKAFSDFQTSLTGFEQNRLFQHAAEVRAEIGDFYYEQASADSAVIYYKMGLEQGIADPLKKGKVLYFLSDILYQSGKDQESQEYAKAYVELQQRLKADQLQLAFSELNMQFLDKNRLLRRLNEYDKQTQRRYALLSLGIMTLFLLLALLFARVQRQKRRLAERDAENARQQEALAHQQTELARRNEQIALGEKLDLLKDRELETSYARLEGQDEMQKKIGKELHEGVSTMLSIVKLNLAPVDEVLDKLPTDKQEIYAKANRLLDQACEEVRRISHELSSAVLTKFGLQPQLEALRDAITGSGKLQVELATHDLHERLDYKTELNIYRMVQELVHNTIKHAGAQNLSIQVNRFGDEINIMVEDDGKGFDAEAIKQKPGTGMQNLAARVHDLGGQMQIDTRIGHGTTIAIDIPLPRENVT